MLRVEVVPRAGEALAADLARRLADAAGAAFGTGPGHTWAAVTLLPEGAYAENGAASDGPYHPVFVRVLKQSVPSGEDLESEIAALTRSVAEACGRDPSQVHVIYEPAAAGRVAFGGQLVR